MAYSPFTIQVAAEKIDSYLAYRLIDPGYELWNKMGIYQRDLESYTQTPIIENKMSGNNCVNCHSFCMQNPDKMLFHMRETFPGTILVDGDKIDKLNTKTRETISSLVYPSWHPSGKYVAFSVNTTKQAFHLNDKNRVEVYDEASDVVDVYKRQRLYLERLVHPFYLPGGGVDKYGKVDMVCQSLEILQLAFLLLQVFFVMLQSFFHDLHHVLRNLVVLFL